MNNNNLKNEASPEKLDQLITINNIVSKICGIRETNHIMELIISELIKVTNSDQGVISLISGPNLDNLSTVIRVNDQSQRELPYFLNMQLIGWIQKNKTLLKIDELTKDNRFQLSESYDGKYERIICYPMIARGEIIGIAILIRNQAKKPFEDYDCRLMGILIPQSAQILANAKLMEDLTKSNELLRISADKLKEDYIRLRNEIGEEFAFENIIGKSSGMRKVMALASRFSLVDSPVLICGETGTGKDLIARAIHFNGARKNHPFVVINCGLKTETLLESELFGHLKGSFTGAIRNKLGLFKEADGGTLFLDEIGDAPLSTQAAILRVIQNGEIRPIGSTKTETVNVRIISATNKDLQDQISSGAFREDLYYRLNRFMIDLPPLRDRKADISLLTNYILNKIKIKIGREKLAITSAALDTLIAYKWPGNIRELENELERAAVISKSEGIIELDDLSPNLVNTGLGELSFNEFKGDLKEAVEKVEKAIIRRTLIECEGNFTQTAKALGLTRKGLMNKLSRYKIALELR
jgi:transcriptional regulator with GAF, ATPase, and Fis domain